MQKGGDTRETDFFHASGTHARFACVNPLGESYEDRIQAIAHLTKGPMRIIFCWNILNFRKVVCFMKKIFAMVLAMLFCFTLFCACTPQDDPSGTDSSVQASTDRVIDKDLNETDGSVQSTESGSESDSSSGSSIEDQEDLFDEELAAKADAIIYVGSGSASDGEGLLVKNDTKFYLASHRLINVSFNANTTAIAYPATALKTATFVVEGVSHNITFQKAEQLPLAACKDSYLKKLGTLLLCDAGSEKYIFGAESEDLRYYYNRFLSDTGNPLSEDVAKAKAESVLREIYGNDFEDGYTFYAYGAGFGKSAVFVTFRRYLHGVATVDHLSVSFLGDQVSSIDARQKDYFGGNSKNITREMVDRAIESMRVYLGVESLSREACMLMVNEDGRYLLRCIYDQEYFIEVK